MTIDAAKLVAEQPEIVDQLLAKADAEIFLNEFCKIRNFQTGQEIPFHERPIQAELRKAIQANKLVAALKARELGWTWELAEFTLWEAWHFAPYQCIYFCQREDNAFDFIGRIRWAHSKLPPHIGYPPETGSKSQHSFKIRDGEGNESEILAFPSVPSAIQTWHPRRIIADEWGLIEEPILPAVMGAIGLDGYFVGLGTAEGLENEHAKVYISCRDGYPGRYAPEGREFVHVFGSWMDHPGFVDDKGRPLRPSAGTKKDTERMYPENDREAFALTAPGDPVYPEFRSELHVAKENIKAEPGRPLLRGWDFGNTPGCIVCQINSRGQVCVLRQFQVTEPGIFDFGEHVKTECNLEWPDAIWIDYGDPSGAARRETDARSCFEILRNDLGIAIKAGQSQWTPRREAVARRLSKLVDGEPQLMVSPRCELLIQGFAGMYHFAKTKSDAAVETFRERRYAMERRS